MNKDFNPLVTIVIPVYNGSNYMKEAIDSALAQTYKNIEIIVVNDGSTDNTDEIARSYGDKIRYFKKENGGVATALNLAIKEAKGDYISWLSHDDVYLPNKIEVQINKLKEIENKNTAIYTNSEYIDKNNKTLYISTYEYREANNLLNNGKYAVLYGLISGCTLLIRKNLILKYGGFDENLRYTQDYDLWYRMFSNESIYFIPDVTVKTRVHNQQDFQKKCDKQSKEITQLWKKILNSITEKDCSDFNLSIYGIHNYLLNFFNSQGNSPNHKEMANYLTNYLANNKTDFNIQNIKVSIIIPYFNRASLVQESIESVLKQTHQNFEIILINDNSTEDMSILNKYQKNDKIIFINNKHKKGVSGARNTGLEYANGDYVAFLDSDDIFFPEKLEKQLKFMLLNGAKFCATSYQQFFENGETKKQHLNKDNLMISKAYTIAPSMVMMSKEIYKNYVYKTDLTIGEDICYWLNIAQKYHLHIYDEILTNFRVGKNTTCNSPEKSCIGLMNIFTYLYKDLNLKSNIHFYDNFFNEISILQNRIKYTRKKVKFFNNKLWILFYKFFLRPILKLLYGKRQVKEKYDFKYL